MMRQFSNFLILLATASLIASPVAAQTWRVGTEREVDEGFYMKLVYSQDGWRVWRTETKSGVRCKAVKSAKGLPHPQPLGVHDTLWQGTPYIRISRGYEDRASVDLVGRWGYGGEWRDVGAKFWQERPDYQDLAVRDAHRIEVHIETWEYNAVKVGLADERGVIDLTGFGSAIAKLEECDKKISVPPARDPSKPAIKTVRSVRYPYDAMRAGASGTVRYLAKVGVDGKAISCEIIEAHEFDSLNEETCKTIMERTVFRPALDSNLRPVEGVYEGDLKFAP